MQAQNRRGNIATIVLLAFGVLVLLAGQILFYNIGGAADFVIKNLTSRSLGSLAPGYAASSAGLKVYAYLVVAIGMVLIGLGVLEWAGRFGVILVIVGIFIFVVFSIVAIAGEVKTYRALKP